MQASPTPFEAVARVNLDWAALVGGTPLVRLRHSGEGRVLLKVEGRQASGSYWDRVVAAQFAALPAGVPVVFAGRHAHSVAVAAFARATGRAVFMLESPSDEVRLSALVGAYGAAVVETLPSGAVLLGRNDVSAHAQAFAGWLSELPADLVVGGAHLVLPAFAGLVAAVEALAPELPVTWVADDEERQRTLGADAACRRTQVAHREGVLLSPIGAELVDAGVAVAVSGGGSVVVLVPEGGQRHLGWW